MNRGNRKASIFDDDRDRLMFLRLLTQTSQTYEVEVLMDVLLGTHFHMVVTTPHGNLSEFMQQLEGQYAQYSNWRHARVGHLFQDRFKAVEIENDIHLFTAFHYVVNNPVAARLVTKPEEWIWGSYRATIGLCAAPPHLNLHWLRVLFPARTMRDSKRLCRTCINDAHPVQAYLQAVDPTAEEAIVSYITAERLRTVSQPCEFVVLARPALDALFPAGLSRREFEAAVVSAHEGNRYTLTQIARHVGIHPATTSKIYCDQKRARLKTGSDPDLNNNASVALNLGSDPNINERGQAPGGNPGSFRPRPQRNHG